MPRTRQLGREDVMFVAGETESLYQHVGLLIILDPAGSPGFDFAHFREQCAVIENMYPMSIITAGMAVNFTCVSYNDTVDFGIVVDPDQVPDHHNIADGLEAARKEYLAQCLPGRKSAKRASAGAKA